MHALLRIQSFPFPLPCSLPHVLSVCNHSPCSCHARTFLSTRFPLFSFPSFLCSARCNSKTNQICSPTRHTFPRTCEGVYCAVVQLTHQRPTCKGGEGGGEKGRELKAKQSIAKQSNCRAIANQSKQNRAKQRAAASKQATHTHTHTHQLLLP